VSASVVKPVHMRYIIRALLRLYFEIFQSTSSSILLLSMCSLQPYYVVTDMFRNTSNDHFSDFLFVVETDFSSVFFFITKGLFLNSTSDFSHF